MIDGETREVSELGPAIRERFELSYTHCAAFIFLAVGYILSIFGEKNADNWSIAFWVLLFTAALWGLAKVVILCLLRQERVTMKATEEELKKY
ncbi:MAG: hypothetical protein LUI08_01490, partial [Prevotella sp.]|nr:hypothetical protein [Prevotella sp.]